MTTKTGIRIINFKESDKWYVNVCACLFWTNDLSMTMTPLISETISNKDNALRTIKELKMKIYKENKDWIEYGCPVIIKDLNNQKKRATAFTDRTIEKLIEDEKKIVMH